MIGSDVRLGEGVVIAQPDLVNLYGCSIGAGTKVGPFVEIQRNVKIGKNCKVSSHSFICEGVQIGNGVFIGHGVVFTNDLEPEAVNQDGTLKTDADWTLLGTIVEDNAAIGSNATILCGITIGQFSLVGAGSVVTADVPDRAVVAGVPARVLRYRE